MTAPTPEISLADFHALHGAGTRLIDVREADEFTAGHVPGAVPMPLSTLPERLDQVPPGTLYIICASGRRSLKAADLLAGTGRTAISVAGGTSGWKQAGGPLDQGTA
jgi:thioredoxin 1